MSDLIEFAKREFDRIGMTAGGDPYNVMGRNAVLELLTVFSNQDHSGFTAGYARATFNRLSDYQPLSPLTGADDEWGEDHGGVQQNNRCYSVFRDADGSAYQSDAFIMTDDDESFYTGYASREPITFPYTPQRKHLTAAETRARKAEVAARKANGAA